VAPRVLLARQDNAGDVLLMGPAVRAVAASAARVTLLAGPAGRAAAELLPGVDEVVCEPAGWIDAHPRPVDRATTMALVDRLAGLGVDQAVVFTSFHQSPLPLALLLRLAGVGRIAAVSVDYPGSLLDVRHQVPDDVHEVERALSLVATLGYRLPAGDDGRLAVRGPLPPPPAELAGAPYVVVHPGASVPARAWDAAGHASLVRSLAGAGWRVAVTGGPGELALTAAVAGSPPPPEVADLGGRLSLRGLAGVLAGAAAVVVGNTGPAHLAAAVGTPVVSLFAPTVPAARWRPWRVPTVLLGDQAIGCAGCRARVCPVAGHPCLSSVGVREVADAVERLAGSPASRPAAPVSAGGAA
jgi:ADP-heptose:LPS heptosyltransferase